jgi:hypothetical protein
MYPDVPQKPSMWQLIRVVHRRDGGFDSDASLHVGVCSCEEVRVHETSTATSPPGAPVSRTRRACDRESPQRGPVAAGGPGVRRR